jgi:hypothetical protein
MKTRAIAVLALITLAVPAQGDEPVPATPAVAPVPAPTPPPIPAPAPEIVRTKEIIVQPIPWAFGAYGGSFEIALMEKFSLVFGLNLFVFTVGTNSTSGTAPNTFSSSNNFSALGGGIQPGIAYYLAGRAPSGLWISPKLELSYLSLTTSTTFTNGTNVNTNSSTTSGFVYGGHVMIGYTCAFDSGFTLQGGVGLGYSSSSFSTSSGGGPVGSAVAYLGSFGRLSLGAGWTF